MPKREIFDRSDFPDFHTIKSSWVGDLVVKILTYCRGPNEAPASGQVEVPNSQLISCLDSSLGRVAACEAGVQRFAPRP